MTPQQRNRIAAFLLGIAALSGGALIWTRLSGSPQSESLKSGGAPARPPQPPPWPRLSKNLVCVPLQRRLDTLLGPEARNWSITIARQDGVLWADLNGRVPRKPASNLKLITSALALDRMGPQAVLNTHLWLLPNGRLRLVGEGDPDLFAAQWRGLASRIAALPGPAVRQLEWSEEPRSQWWAPGWTADDRFLGEGPPITRLSLGSNLNEASLADPVGTLQRLLNQHLRARGRALHFVGLSPNRSLPPGAELLWRHRSVRLGVLLDHVNSESQNYTAEVLLRQGTGHWNLPQALRLAHAWLRAQGLSTAGLRMVDGSGLAHDNRLTSRLLIELFLRMSAHPLRGEFFSSMAVVGQKGTMLRYFPGWGLAGVFKGKSGSLTGVRNTSGFLDLGGQRFFVVMFSQNVPGARERMAQILDALRREQANPACSLRGG